MTKKSIENIPEFKKKTVKELVGLIKNKKTFLVVDISGIPGSQYQQIGKKLRGKAILKVPKKNLLFRAIKESGKKEVERLKEKIEGAVGLLFSDSDSFELARDLLKTKSPSKAKAGQIAPSDIEIPAGPTDLVPGPAISELGALGIQIQIQGGKIEIKEPKVVAKEGEKISQGAADIMGKLDIKPFSIGFNPIAAYDSEEDKVYFEIKIDKEATIGKLRDAFYRALPFAIIMGYISKDTVKAMIQKAAREERRLVRGINGEPEEILETPVEEVKDTPKEEAPKEEKKGSSSEGLASLFG